MLHNIPLHNIPWLKFREKSNLPETYFPLAMHPLVFSFWKALDNFPVCFLCTVPFGAMQARSLQHQPVYKNAS